MSSLLKEAIVDARALKEAALKNAEAVVIEKYSTEVKDTIDKLLEQDDLDLQMGGALSGEEMGDPTMGMDPAVPDAPIEEVEEVTEDTIPLASTDGLSKEVGVGLEETPLEGEEVEFNVSLDALHEAIQEIRDELEEDEEIEINEEDLEAMMKEAPTSVIGSDAYASTESPAAAGALQLSADHEAMDSLANLDEEEEELEELKPAPGSSGIAPPEEQEKWKNSPIGKELGATGAKKPPSERGKKGKRAEVPDAPTFAQQYNAYQKQKAAGEDPEYKPEMPHRPISPQQASVKQVGGRRGNFNEDLEISEDLIDAVIERLTVDMGATLKGWAGRSSEDIKWELTKALAHRRSTDFEDEMKDLKKAQEELVFENNQIKEHNNKYKQTVAQLKENLQDINLSNARLLYTNRVLRNTSLNERQKEKLSKLFQTLVQLQRRKQYTRHFKAQWRRSIKAKPTIIERS